MKSTEWIKVRQRERYQQVKSKAKSKACLKNKEKKKDKTSLYFIRSTTSNMNNFHFQTLHYYMRPALEPLLQFYFNASVCPHVTD